MAIKIKRLLDGLLKHQRRQVLVSIAFSAGIIPIMVILFWFRKVEPVIYLSNESAEKAWSELLTAHPFAPNIEPQLIKDMHNPIRKTIGADRPSLYLYISGWENRDGGEPPAPEPLSSMPARKKLLTTRYYAPTVPFWSEQKNIGLQELKATTVQPLEGIRLPDKAISVEGKYPNEQAYPLKKNVWLEYTQGQELWPGHSRQELTKWYENLPVAKPDLPELVWIGATGDLMLERGVGDLLINKGGQAVFNDLLPLFQKQDLLLGNLEGAVTKEKASSPKAFTFRFQPATLSCLQAAGFDYLALANNHTFDFGLKGFKDTLYYLKQAGIAYSGAGENFAAAIQPWRTDIRDQTISILALGAYPKEQHTLFDGEKETQATAERAGVLWATDATIEDIATSFSPATFDIVMIHGGEEWQVYPTAKQRALYEKLIKKGADLVLGSHPHILEGMKVSGDKLICFSLGNFLFNGMETMPHAEDTLLLSIGVIQNRITYLDYYPARIKTTSVALDYSDKISKHFIKLTKELNK